MSGMNESWPPAEAATTYVIDGADWPGVDWPSHIMSTNRSQPSAPKIPDRDTWTGEGGWGQYWIGVGGPCADRSPPAGYWCAPRAPRRIGQPNHAAGVVLSTVSIRTRILGGRPFRPFLAPQRIPRGVTPRSWY